MSGAMNRHCIPGLTMSSTASDGNFWSVWKNKRCTQGLVHVLQHYANAPVLTRKKPTL